MCTYIMWLCLLDLPEQAMGWLPLKIRIDNRTDIVHYMTCRVLLPRSPIIPSLVRSFAATGTCPAPREHLLVIRQRYVIKSAPVY